MSQNVKIFHQKKCFRFFLKFPKFINLKLKNLNFWNLKTSDDHFEVTLSFSGEKKNIFVPFKAIISFTDPSVGFGLQFKIEDNLKDANLSKIDDLDINKPMITNLKDTDVKSGEVVSLDEFRDKK